MTPRLRELALGVTACALTLAPGCYTGLASEAGPGDGDSTGRAPGEGGGSAEDGGSDGAPGEASCEGERLGASPLQRLTRTEYDHTIADLLGIDTHPARALPPDGLSGLFANNGATTVPSYAVEVYRDLAESLAATATADLPGLLPCDPAQIGEDACAAAFIEDFGRRAWRRPLDAAQVDRLLALYQQGRTEGSFTEGIGLVIEAVLQSPWFLYRIESGVPAAGEEAVALDGFELASRLSYFLWRSMPDDALLAAAEAGELDDPEAVEAQVRRMLDDPRAERALLTFFGELFALDTTASLYKDPELFDTYSPELAADMRTELELFVLSILRDGDGRIDTLLGASHTFVNARLAALYGIDAPPGDGFTRVELEPSRSRGLLTKPALMALSAHDQRTSPTLRGKLVRTRLLCQGLPPPPANVDSSVPAPGELSTREWVQQRLDNPSCATCHELMDLIGLGFEHFDAMGRYRAEEDGAAIDAHGLLVDTDVDGPFDGPSGLADKLVDSEQVGTCIAHEWFEFGMGRAPSGDDACTTAALDESFASTDHDITELMVAIATSPAFRLRRPDDLEEAP